MTVLNLSCPIIHFSSSSILNFLFITILKSKNCHRIFIKRYVHMHIIIIHNKTRLGIYKNNNKKKSSNDAILKVKRMIHKW